MDLLYERRKTVAEWEKHLRPTTLLVPLCLPLLKQAGVNILDEGERVDHWANTRVLEGLLLLRVNL